MSLRGGGIFPTKQSSVIRRLLRAKEHRPRNDMIINRAKRAPLDAKIPLQDSARGYQSSGS